jgi:hypothetical protein
MQARKLDDQQRASLLDRLFRRLSKLDDDSLIQLETITRAAESGAPIAIPQSQQAPTKADPDQLSRRYFLASLLAGGVLAASAGGAAAVALTNNEVRQWLSEQGWLPPDTPQLPTGTPGPSPIPSLPPQAQNEISSLQGQVFSLTTERDSLREQLAAATTQLTTLQSNHDIASELVNLYKQLEVIDIDGIITAALAAIGVPIVAIEAIRQALNGGATVIVRLLESVEDQLPLIAAGLDWLEDQVDSLALTLTTLREALEITGNTPLAQGATRFVSSVLDLLPFGVGQNIKRGLQLMGEVIARLPDLLNNVSARLLLPARALIVSDKQTGLYSILLQPVRDQLLTPAQQMIANAENLNTVYNNQLAQPTQTALEERARIRAEISQKAGAFGS